MTEREQFEASGITTLLSRSTEPEYTHEYADTHTQYAWRGWQAATRTVPQFRLVGVWEPDRRKFKTYADEDLGGVEMYVKETT